MTGPSLKFRKAIIAMIFLIFMAGCSTDGTDSISITDTDPGSDQAPEDKDGQCSMGNLHGYDNAGLTFYYFAEGSSEVHCSFQTHQVGIASSPGGTFHVR